MDGQKGEPVRKQLLKKTNIIKYIIAIELEVW